MTEYVRKTWRDGVFEVSAALMIFSAAAAASVDLFIGRMAPIHKVEDVTHLTALAAWLSLAAIVCACFGRGWPRIFFLATALIEFFKFQSFLFS